MAYLDKTQGEHFIPELWAEPIYKFLFANMKLRNSVDDYSSLVKNAGDTIHIPKIPMEATADKSASTAVTFSSSAATKIDLTIDKHKYKATIFEDIATIQSNFELISKYTRMYGESLARKVEDDMWLELDGFTTTRVMATANVMVAADLENLLSDLYQNDIDPNDCSMALNYNLTADMLNPDSGISKYFVRADASGEGQGLRTGAVGLIYGMSVFYSRTIGSGTSSGNVNGAVYRSDACAFAAQQDVRVQAQYDVEYLGTKVVADMIYGIKLIDESGHVLGLNITAP